MQKILPRGSASAVAVLLPVTAGLVAVAYFPGAIAPATTLRWALMSVLVPLLLLLIPVDGGRVRLTPGHWMTVLLLAYALLSTLWAVSWTEAVNGWWQLALLCGCILTGSLASSRTLDMTYRVFAVALLPSVLVAVLQAANLPTWGIEQAREYPSGLFMSSQLYGEIGALGFVLAPVGGLTQLGLLLGVILSGSRAAMLAVALAGAILYVRTIRDGKTRWPGAGVLAGILGIGVGLYLGFAKTTSILLSAEDQLGGGLSRASALRWPLWTDTINALTAFGHGIGSYFVAMPGYVQSYPVDYIGRPEFAENEFLNFAFELGLPGALLLAGIFGLALVRGSGLKPRLAVLALLVVSCLGFPLHMPATVFLGGLVLGHCLREPEPVGARDRDASTARQGTAPS
ncbi:MAG: O-antigen ligase family protein [Chromatiales bacterium]|nr:O-antigen ligase family protein [Chromatiales bacterium]